MKNPLKIGMLGVLLVIPIFVYLFLKFYGTNHYRLPIYYPIETIEVLNEGKQRVDTLYHSVPGFNFLDQNGIVVTNQSLKGKIWIADFFFTRCPGICPIITSNLISVQETFIDDPDIGIISFSVDPVFDRPAILKKYEAKFGINDKKWLLTTGTQIGVYNLGFYGFKLPADTLDKTLHSEKVVLLDKEQRIRGYYTGTDKEEINRLITEVKVLQHEYKYSSSK